MPGRGRGAPPGTRPVKNSNEPSAYQVFEFLGWSVDRLPVVPERGEVGRASPPPRRRGRAAGRSASGFSQRADRPSDSACRGPAGGDRVVRRVDEPAGRRTARPASRARRPPPTDTPTADDRPLDRPLRSEPDQHAEHEERRRADRDELPVDVDERVEHERARPERKRRRGRALVRLHPPDAPSTPRPPPPRQPEQEQEADDPGLGQELERQVVRLRRHDRPLPDRPPGDLERRRALAAAGRVRRRATTPPSTTSSGCSS